MNKNEELQHLLHLDIIQDTDSVLIKNGWQTLYTRQQSKSHDFTVWCALVEDRALRGCLERDSWDLFIGDGRPGMTQSFSPHGSPTTTYHPHGDNTGIRALIHHRFFHGAFPSYFEINEEFRLFHNLAYDEPNTLIDFDESGYKNEVVHLSTQHIDAQIKYLRKYQAATQQHLVIFIESLRYANVEHTAEDEFYTSDQKKTVRWKRYIRKNDSSNKYKTCSHLMMKIVFHAPAFESFTNNLLATPTNSKDVTFIIGVDNDGENIEYSSNHTAVNYQSPTNHAQAHYLTPVYFRREVLTRYYDDSARFKVSDGSISCYGLWHCRIDNDNPSYVVVFLGDLARDLPDSERLHWRLFNIPPREGMSKTSVQRNFAAEFTDPTQVDLLFRREYVRFSEEWETQFGWPFFLPLHEGDKYIPDIIRIAVTDSQEELDTQVLHLTKLLVDSLNEKKVISFCVDTGIEGGISKLDCFLQKYQFKGHDVILFLRQLQKLRSKGTGHRKGSEYQKELAKQSLSGKKPNEVMEHLLNNAVSCIHSLRKHFIDANITL